MGARTHLYYIDPYPICYLRASAWKSVFILETLAETIQALHRELDSSTQSLLGHLSPSI